MLKKENILGVSITKASTSEILEYVLTSFNTSDKKLFIVTPNPEIIVYAQNNLDYQSKLNSADVSLADGVGLLIAGKVLGREMPERTTGVDFIHKLCETSRDPRFNRGEKPLSIGLLGGRDGVAHKTGKCLKQKYPWIDVVFTGEEWLDTGANASMKTQKPIDILFVAYGFPKQENWIFENLPNLPVKAAMGVGGAFDYISGNVPRAPKFMRAVGLEWFFRLVIQPWRFKRQLALLTFMYFVFHEKRSAKT